MFVAQHWPKPKILIVEDSFLTADAVGDMVRECGCDVAATVGHVEGGVEFLRDHAVDAAVVDIDLHGRPSFPICNQLTRRDIPFLFLTGYDSRYEIPPEFEGKKLISKPVDDQEFESAVLEMASAGRAWEARRSNLILDRLSIADWRLVRPRLAQVAIKAGEILETPGRAVGHLYFPMTGLVSIRACSAQGKRIEVGLVGHEGMIGTAALLNGVQNAEVESVVQHPGLAWRVEVSALAKLLYQNQDLHAHLLHAAHAFMSQMARNALSIGHGTVEQRLARQLLMISDRLGTKSVTLTHDGLAKGLAVRRSGVTVALHMLEARRVIRTRRHSIEILDRNGLVREAGDTCWTAVDASTVPEA